MMHILKKIFVPNSASKIDEMVSNVNNEDFISLFKLDLENLSLSDFESAYSEVLKNGDIIFNYAQKLPYRECKIFDNIKLKITATDYVNVTLSCSQPESLSSNTIKTFIDSLYSIYGPDCYNKQGFSKSDEEDFNEVDLFPFFGRNWLDYPKYKYPISLRRSMTDLSLSIWGIKYIENA